MVNIVTPRGIEDRHWASGWILEATVVLSYSLSLPFVLKSVGHNFEDVALWGCSVASTKSPTFGLLAQSHRLVGNRRLPMSHYSVLSSCPTPRKDFLDY